MCLFIELSVGQFKSVTLAGTGHFVLLIVPLLSLPAAAQL